MTPAARYQHLKLLFWLKWKLTTRGYQRSSTAAAGVILGLLVFLPLVALAAIGSYMAYVNTEPGVAQNILRGVLLGAYAFWLISPMMGFAVNESFDVTKLFVYPITVRQILIGAIAGSILDFPVLFLLPTLFSAFLGFATGGLPTVIIALALFLFLGHTLCLGQSIVLATSGMLRSRRYRDLLMVLIPLISIAFYFVQEMSRRGSLHVDWQGVTQSRTWQVLGFLPPGITARAIVAAREGDLEFALMCCGVLVVLTVATVFLAAALIQKVYAGETDVIRIKTRLEPAKSRPATTITSSAVERLPFGLRLSPAAEAVYHKEVRYMSRDPSFKAALMNLAYTLLVAVFMVMPRPGHDLPVRIIIWPATCIVLMSEMRFFFNLFGTEGAAATLFFLYPASRRDMLIGKNAIYLLVGVLINLVLTVVICIISKTVAELPYLLFWMVMATGFFVAAGDIISVLFPMRVVTKGHKVKQMGAGQGCAFGMFYLGMSLATLVALGPVILAILLPRLWLGMSWLALTLPLAVAYVVAAMVISLRLAERLLLEREMDVMRKLGAEE